MALFFLLANAYCWATRSQTNYGAQISEIQAMMKGDKVDRPVHAQLGWLWTLPEDVHDPRGLGGGITWAWNPALCQSLRFKENAFGFVGCQEIRTALARAFDKWSANNRFIKFVDVTRECELAGKLYGPPTDDPQEETKHIHGGCPLAEIWVTKQEPQNINSSAERQSQSEKSVAAATQYSKIVRDFRYTNGRRPFLNSNNSDYRKSTGQYNRQVIETYAGKLTFDTDGACWYLDSYFCSGFHRLKVQLGGPGKARKLVHGLGFGLMAVGLTVYVVFLVQYMKRVFRQDVGRDSEDRKDDEDGDGQLSVKERWYAGLRHAADWNPAILTTFIILIIIPPLLNNQIIMPCWDCYDFEAAALHEIGHFLGLGHPNNIPADWYAPREMGGFGNVVQAGPTPGQNSYSEEISKAVLENRRPNFTCTNPWASVRAGVPEGAGVDDSWDATYPYRSAQMEARTQHNPEPCLREDDLEALAVLYPDCGAYALSGAVCHNVALNIGWLRIAIFILIPTLMAFSGVLLMASCVIAFEEREEKRSEDKAKVSAIRAFKGALKNPKRKSHVTQHKKVRGKIQLKSTEVST
eukprot:CAMPEP_0119309582 /NCGR_PEP_ID=MMETSP1333-20130426/15845_1 /TAXON_ID=418940 /ORGANISM="Scyphosphaera apsteinii, Strain RCC1455" /LENGTH=578 /DNA_ID=CAMNT_0007313575 /DNA_START=76 /DNA_END=1812 /DNA_ORIENTATION=-